MAIDLREFHDAVMNEINDELETVLTVGWSGGCMPGTAGAVWFKRWRGIYLMSSSDYDPEGPMFSIEEVLQHETICRHIYGPEVSSDVIAVDRLLVLAREMVVNEGEAVEVNDVTYVLDSGQLKPCD